MKCRIVLALAVFMVAAGRFESDSLSEQAAAPQPAPKPQAVEPPKPEVLDAAIRNGVDFLLKDQNEDGSWGSAERTKGLNIWAPVPGAHHAFRAAVTSLCVAALIEIGDD